MARLEMQIRPSTTPALTADICGLPSLRRVDRTVRSWVRTKSIAALSSTRTIVADRDGERPIGPPRWTPDGVAGKHGTGGRRGIRHSRADRRGRPAGAAAVRPRELAHP